MKLEQLLIVGNGPCGRALAQAAALLDRFRITIADERFDAVSDMLPENEKRIVLTKGYPELPPLVDSYTHVAIVSRDALADELALRQVLSSEARYVGMMGSRKKVSAVFESLRASGIGDSQIARVHAPIGLDIGAQTPAEIATSILAQIIAESAATAKTQQGT